MGHIGWPINVDLATRKWQRNQRARWLHQQETRTLVATERMQFGKDLAGKHSRNAKDTLVSRGHNRRRCLRTKHVKHCAQVLGRKSWLVAGKNQGARSLRITGKESTKTRPN